MRKKLALGLATVSTAAAGYELLLRPWHLRWGATDDEVHRVLPGDTWVPRPRTTSTRAITIQAPPADVWPWLAQMGTGRAGWYSYAWLENLLPASAVGAGITNAERIVPELQHLEVGDSVPLSPTMGFTVEELDRGHLIALRATMSLTGMPLDPDAPKAGASFAGSWVFVLDALEGGRTRLIERMRADYRPALLMAPLAYVVMEPIFFVMEREMLMGIKRRAEGRGGGYGPSEQGHAEQMVPSVSQAIPAR